MTLKEIINQCSDTKWIIDDRNMGRIKHLKMTIGQCFGRTLEGVNVVHRISATSNEECGCLDPAHAMSERFPIDKNRSNRL